MASRRCLASAQPLAQLARRLELGWQLIAAGVAQQLVLGGVDVGGLLEDLPRDLLVVEVAVRGVRVQLRAIYRSPAGRARSQRFKVPVRRGPFPRRADEASDAFRSDRQSPQMRLAAPGGSRPPGSTDLDQQSPVGGAT